MKNKIQRVIYYFVTMLITAAVLIIFVIKPGINENKPSLFAGMVYGKASKPYVNRLLLPVTVRVLSSFVPKHYKKTLGEKIESSKLLHRLFHKLRWENKYAVEYLFAMLLMFLSLFGFSIAVRKYFTLFYHAPPIFSDSVSLLALLGLPPMFRYTSFLYDFPLLLFFTLGLIFLFKKNWKYFILFFLIGCFNKETTILLSLIFYIFYRHKFSKNLFNKLLAAQLSIFVLVKLLLFFIFKNNQGNFLEFHLIDHNLRLLTGYNLTFAISVLGILLLIFYKWKEKPEFVKTSLWVFVPLVVLAIFFGYVDELRDYYEIYPSVIVLISVNISSILDIHIIKSG